jgi:PAS domain S-box-containing protein
MQLRQALKGDLYRLLMDQILPDPLFVHDHAGRFIEVNAKACETLGYTRAELLTMGVLDLEQDFDLRSAQSAWSRIQAGSTAILYGHQRHKSGRIFPVEVHFGLLETDAQRLYFGTVRDVSERAREEMALRDSAARLEAAVAERTAQLQSANARLERQIRERDDAERRLAASEQRYRLLIEDQSELISLAAVDGTLLFVNHAYAERFGLESDEVIGRSLFDFLPEQERDAVRQHLEAVVEARGIRTGENRMVAAGGAHRWVAWTNRAVLDQRGVVTAIHSVGRDITDRKAAESALREANERFAVAADAAGLGFWSRDLETKMLQWDDKMYRLYGLARREGAQPDDFWHGLLHPEDRERVQRELAGSAQATGSLEAEFRILQPGGALRHLRASGNVHRDQSGRAVQMYGVTMDITERKRAAEQFRLAIEAAPTGMLLTDQAGRIRLVNQCAESIFGYTRAALLGETIESLVPGAVQERHVRLRNAFSSAPIARRMGIGRDLHGLRSDGTQVPVEIALTPMQTADGEFVLASVVDITERKQARERLQQLNAELEERVRQRTANLREKEAMLQEIHHRVKNNLQVISSLINMQANALQDPPSRAALQDCRLRVQSMALIHEKLYESQDYARVTFAEYARDLAVHVLRANRTCAESIGLDFALEPLLLPVAQAIPCGLILNELISNALKHAYPSGRAGTLRVTLRRLADHEAELAVADDGVGIAADCALERATTLGMRLVHSLAEQLHGRLETVRGAGTSFRITFPVAASEAGA